MESDEHVMKKQLLGEILVKREMITQQQLDKALKVQKKENKRVGEILIEMGFVEESDILIALVVQCNFPYIAIDKYEIEQNVIQLIPKEIILKHQVVPLDRVGDILSVVMADPLDLASKVELQRVTNCTIAPFIATRAEIQRAIVRWYGKE